MFKTILGPTDASDVAQRALKVALKLAKELGFYTGGYGYTLSNGVSVSQEEISRECTH